MHDGRGEEEREQGAPSNTETLIEFDKETTITRGIVSSRRQRDASPSERKGCLYCRRLLCQSRHLK